MWRWPWRGYGARSRGWTARALVRIIFCSPFFMPPEKVVP
ncbi:hypothetical protein HU200_007885 [Digitaria exilis]|uniref:Uncharacterized protein n=1 Tax=Digitaria exilis TaxID=1010633 RepID=A0A835FNH6_9POAL|nr:hypothetical protein HU200_007885 [Digitaria exilis]